ncbi:ABC transporter substrate-binding protein [Alicyclobacillus sp. SO9]|uniref:ABC transporter substrate-binding protein n=1 Tax=Alicyclobacillus sp. SO9 TaxID=2665646 RepID=UPI0019370D6F|nr:extracellular solute-binding protein [Alicyclobacillus sp. SO9]QQE78998.1 extracellular solute-binding protein [Alicyclobacillus sp. SO9]
MRNMKHTALSFLAIAGTAVVISGCGTGTNNAASSGSGSQSNTTSNSTKSSSAKSQKLVIYSAQGYDKAMGKAFEKATGIKTVVKDASTGPTVADVEAQKNNPHWDVVWFDGPSTMQSLDNQGLLLKNWTPNDFSNYTALGKKNVPSDHAYFPGGITAAVALAYDTKNLPASKAPKTYSDLLKPEFKNAFGMNNPSVSGPAYPFVAGMMQMMGQTKGKQFFTQAKKNGMQIFRTNGVTLKALTSGKIKVAAIQDSALISAKQKGAPIKIVYPTQGTFTLPDVMGIAKNAPDMAAAKKFVEFVLSKQGQKAMINPKNGGGDSYYNPIIKGIKPDSARQQGGINWFSVNPVKAAKNENQLKKWFNDNITH